MQTGLKKRKRMTSGKENDWIGTEFVNFDRSSLFFIEINSSTPQVLVVACVLFIHHLLRVQLLFFFLFFFLLHFPQDSQKVHLSQVWLRLWSFFFLFSLAGVFLLPSSSPFCCFLSLWAARLLGASKLGTEATLDAARMEEKFNKTRKRSRRRDQIYPKKNATFSHHDRCLRDPAAAILWQLVFVANVIVSFSSLFFLLSSSIALPSTPLPCEFSSLRSPLLSLFSSFPRDPPLFPILSVALRSALTRFAIWLFLHILRHYLFSLLLLCFPLGKWSELVSVESGAPIVLPFSSLQSFLLIPFPSCFLFCVDPLCFVSILLFAL